MKTEIKIQIIYKSENGMVVDVSEHNSKDFQDAKEFLDKSKKWVISRTV